MNSECTSTSYSDTEIAVIGMSCRFPGADNLEAFWKNLKRGVESITFYSDEELLTSGIDSSIINHPHYVKAGADLPNIDRFDADFFGYSPGEAQIMDPQHRFFLECAWEALENAGYVPENYAGLIGVYASAGTNMYLMNNLPSHHDLLRSPYGLRLLIGNDKDFAATRISYKLNLRGPSITVQTACSSSLVAVHLACQGLLNGECDMALAGGVTIRVPQKTGYLYHEDMILSPDGHCRAFDEQAQGTVIGNGVGIVVIKRLAEAIGDGDRIYAVIKGSAVNNDGAVKVGYTAPGLEGQAAVISEALAVSEVDPATVTYIEAHGTGTVLGDPIEFAALNKVFKPQANKRKFCGIGSVKTNVGHLAAAAGIAGLIKAVLALDHKLIPPSLHFKRPNPNIDLENSPFYVPTTARVWETDRLPRRAGVSAFGFGGTNVHVVLEEATARVRDIDASDRPSHILTLSAMTPPALQELVTRYQRYFASEPQVPLADLCYTANTGRRHFHHRLAVIGSNKEELARQITEIPVSDNTADSSDKARSDCNNLGKIAFLYTGQGSQYVRMGEELYRNLPTFRRILDHCDEILRPAMGTSLLEILYSENKTATTIHNTTYAQPALFALEYALTQLWISVGVKPDVVMGHSVGEYVAAAAAGVFSIEDGLKLIAERARLMAQVPLEGTMVSVFASGESVRNAISAYTDQVSIAAFNGPENVVISGAKNAINEIVDNLRSEGIETRVLRVSHAFHSPLMYPIIEDFGCFASTITYATPNIDMVSNVTGEHVRGEIASHTYWAEHIRRPVQFYRGMRTLNAMGCRFYLEVGPSSTLLSLGKLCLNADAPVSHFDRSWLFSLRFGKSDWQQLFTSISEFYRSGFDINWSRFDEGFSRYRTPLPTYPFQRKRYWSTVKKEPQDTGESDSPHLKNWFYEVQWQPQMKANRHAWNDPMPQPSEIVESLNTEVYRASIAREIEAFNDAMRQIETISSIYVSKAFQDLGWTFQENIDVTKETLVQQLAVIPKHHRLIDRLLVILTEEGVLQQAGNVYRVVSQPRSVDPNAELLRLSDQYPVALAEIELLKKCGPRLAGVLKGETDPLEILFPEGDTTSLLRLYRDSIWARFMNSIVAQAVGTALKTALWGRGVRILEIGAGTGSTTDYILPHIENDWSEYVFTDVSPLFLSIARERFKDYDFVDYQILDMDKHPEKQGFDLHQFDIVLAANVLHATKRLKVSLSYIKHLLTPGGLLVVVEGVSRFRWVDLVFGLLEGWWRFEDTELRPSYPLLKESQWRSLLTDEGFEDMVAIPFNHENHTDVYQQIAILARPADMRSTEAQKPAEHWMILTDSEESAASLVKRLGDRKVVSTLVFPGTHFQVLENRRFTVHPERRDDFDQALTAALREKLPLKGILYLWHAGAEWNRPPIVNELEAAAKKNLCGLLHLIQALVAEELSDPPRIWLVTREGVPAAGDPFEASGLAQTPLWGFGVVIALEHPEYWGGALDLPAEDDHTESLQALIEEVLNPEDEDRILFRKGKRYVARVTSFQPRQGRRLSFQSNGSYLITGGLGFLGLRAAEWLFHQGVRHLILVSRKSLPERAQWNSLIGDPQVGTAIRTISSLEQMGASVTIYPADVSDMNAMTVLFAALEEGPHPLRGVIHAAGVPGFKRIMDIDVDAMLPVLRPKIQGAWVLHQLSVDLNLDFHIYFSSCASIWGSTAQADYAAANAFLDGLAYYHQCTGLTALSINWGMFPAGSMVTQEAFEMLSRFGFRPMSPSSGYESMRLLTEAGIAQAAVADIDWETFKESFEARGKRHLFDLITTRPTEGDILPSSQSCEIGKQLSESPPEEWRSFILRYLQEQVSEVLGHESSKLKTDTPLEAMGLDSLMAIELRDRISCLGVKLPLRTLLQGTNIDQLTQHIQENYAPSASGENNKTITHQEDRVVSLETADTSKTEALYTPAADRDDDADANDRGFVEVNPWVVVYREVPDARMRLFCFPYGGGGPAVFNRWPDEFDNQLEICAIQLPGRGSRLDEAPLTSIKAVTDALTNALMSLLNKPFAFFGHCLGGIIMFEVAQKLVSEHGILPAHLFASGTRAPHFFSEGQSKIDMMQFSPVPDVAIHELPDAQLLELIMGIGFENSKALLEDKEMQDVMLPAVRADFKINHMYVYQSKPALDVPITAVGGRVDSYVTGEHLMGWRKHTRKDFSISFCRGGHYFIEKERSYLTQLISETLQDEISKPG